jgi:hypothetical protein
VVAKHKDDGKSPNNRSQYSRIDVRTSKKFVKERDYPSFQYTHTE